jgi:hypothetical protein
LASAQFLGASVAEQAYPTTVKCASLSQYMNAYTLGNVIVQNGTTTATLDNVFIYTWDGGNHNTGADHGVAYGYILAGDTLKGYKMNADGDFISTPLENFSGADVVLLQKADAGDVYAVFAYYNFVTQEIIVSYSQMSINVTASTVILDLVSATDNLIAIPTTDFEWVHIDAYDKKHFVVSWSDGGRLYTQKGGFTTTSVPEMLGDTYSVIYDKATNTSRVGSAIDVAMTQDMTTGDMMVNYAYHRRDNGSDTVYVLSIPYDSIPEPSTSTLGIAYVDVVDSLYHDPIFFGDKFGKPRIDSPDDCEGNTWTVVVADHNNRVMASSYYGGSGAPVHATINDGSLGITNVSSYYTPPANPVVAYENDYRFINIGWRADNTTLPNSTYLGVRIRYDMNLVDVNDYWIIPRYYNIHNSTNGGLALSTENKSSNETFVSMIMDLPNFRDRPYYKHVPWSNWGYKPTELSPALQLQTDAVAYPNPFTDALQIYSQEMASSKGVIQVKIIDVLGKEKLNASGTLENVNGQLNTVASKLSSGIYGLQVSYGTKKQTLKIVKE